MTHCVTGIIASPELLADFAKLHALHKPAALASGLALLPLSDEDMDSFLMPPMSGHPEGFVYLSEQLSNELKKASEAGPVLYFETEYFGGTGAQGAAVFKDGTLAMQPISAEIGPINRGLALLGVSVLSGVQDEFDSIGLGLYRHTEDWIERACQGVTE